MGTEDFASTLSGLVVGHGLCGEDKCFEVGNELGRKAGADVGEGGEVFVNEFDGFVADEVEVDLAAAIRILCLHDKIVLKMNKYE